MDKVAAGVSPAIGEEEHLGTIGLRLKRGNDVPAWNGIVSSAGRGPTGRLRNPLMAGCTERSAPTALHAQGSDVRAQGRNR